MSLQLLVLNRELADADGTFGKLILPTPDGLSVWWYTGENDWRDNQPGKSCIPLGHYGLERTIYYKKRAKKDPWWAQFDYETFEVKNVPGRTRILFHPGTTEEDTEGCILLGKALGYYTVFRDEDTGAKEVRKRAVLFSRDAFKDFMRYMENLDKAELRVIGVVG